MNKFIKKWTESSLILKIIIGLILGVLLGLTFPNMKNIWSSRGTICQFT